MLLNDRSSRPQLLSKAFLVVLPAILFYCILFRRLIDLPFADDYEILIFLKRQRLLHGFWPKFMYGLTAQYNEYKLIFGHSIFALQYWLLGHISFSGLSILGDLAPLFLAIVLWKMFLPGQTNLSLRLGLFIPVSWLLFELSYVETLNWAEPALQNLYILVFAFAAFTLLIKEGRYKFVAALLLLVLAIAASGNGFIAAAAGGLVLLHKKRFARLLAWCATTLGMMGLYAWHYDSMSSQVEQHRSVFSVIRDMKLSYLLSFIGSIGELTHLVPHISATAGSISLGIVLCCCFAGCALRGRLSANPAVNAAIVFVFLTAMGVAAIRSGLGVGESTASRYRIYCVLLLILLWFLLAEHGLQKTFKRVRAKYIYGAGCAAAVVLSLVFDFLGYRYLTMRNELMIEGMTLYEHAQPGSTAGPVFTDPNRTIYFSPRFNLMARDLLDDSRTDGIYQPPRY